MTSWTSTAWTSTVRTSALARFALLALLIQIAPAAGAEVIDDFETAQATLTDAGTSVVTDNGADVILGDHRELEIELVEGTAGATAEAAAGALSFDATAGADTRAVATVVWDADTNTTVFDGDGLGGVDLTDNNETAFRIEVDAASADTQILVEVFTNNGNSSKAGLRLPVVAATTNFFISYADFIPNLGTGADFANVGAIVMRILGTNVATDIAFFETVGPTLTVTKIDIDPNDDMDFGTDPVVPGDTIRYRVDITNDGGLAQQVDLTDTVDGNTTFTMDSLTATPVALVDTVAVLGNVTRTVADPGVLANDEDPDNDALFVRVSNSDTMSAEGATVAWNDAGGDDQGEGGFQYFPPAGFRGVDSFNYELEDADGDIAAGLVTVILDRIIWFVDDDHGGPFEGTQANPFADFTQLDDTANDVDQDGDIIFVFAHSGGNYTHAGLELEPGQSLIGEGEGLTVDASVIVPAGASALIHAPDAGAGIQHGATLTMNNTIRGVTFGTTEGHAITGSNFGTLTVSNTTVTGAGGILDVDNGTLDVVLASSSSSDGPGFGIDLDSVDGAFDAGSTTITGGATGGIRVTGGASGAAFDFGGAAVSGVPAGIDLNSSGMATFTFDSVDVTTTGTALNLVNAGSVTIGGVTNTLETTASGAAIIATATEMTGGWTFDGVTSDGSPTHGISLNGMTGGNLLVTGATDINDPMNNGIFVQSGGPRTYDFGAADISGTGVPAGAVGHGIDITTSNTMSTFTFDSLAITTDNGAGLLGNSSGTVNIAGTGNSIASTTGPALDIAMTTVDDAPGGPVTGITFATLSSTNSPTTGVNLVGINGSVTGTAGSIMGAAGTAFNVGTAANNSGGSNNVTYGGSITNSAARSVSVQERNGGGVTLSGNINDTGTGILVTNNNNGVANTVTFSGLSKILNTGANTAVLLDNNDDATVSFTGGGLDIDTSGAVTAFNAINGGTVQVTGTGNSVNTTVGTGVAVNINSTVIGATGVSFQRVDADGAASGIVLNTTGNDGGFTVTGTGAADSGGTIANTTDGLSLNDTLAPSFTEMAILSSVDNGVDVFNLTGLILDSLRLDGAGSHGINADTVTDFTLRNGSVVRNAGNANEEHGIRFRDLFGVSLIEDSTIELMEEDGIEIINDDVDDGAIDVLTVRNSFIQDNNAAGFGENAITARAQDDGNLRVVIDGSTLRRCEGDGVNGAADGADNNGFLDLRIIGTTINDNDARAIALGTANNQDMDVRILDGTNIFGNTTTPIVITGNQSSTLNVTFDNTTGMPADNITVTGSQNVVGGVAARCLELTADDNVSMVVRVADVIATDCDFAGIRALSRNTADLDLTVSGSSFTSSGLGFEEAVTIVAGTGTGGDAGEICLNMLSNTASTGGGFLDDYRLRTRQATNVFHLQDFVGNGGVAGDVQTWVNTTKVNTGTALISIDGASFAAAPGNCAVPPP